MELVITGIGNKGQLAEERVGFKVQKKCNLKNYFIFSTHFMEAGFYNRSKNSFWFPPREANIGDIVVLYTKAGTDSSQKNDDDTTTYYYHWGLTESIFTSENHGVVIGEVNDWNLSRDF